MAIVIGAATQVGFEGACVISASWGFSPNAQRVYCLGSWDPNSTFFRPTETLNLTLYSPGPSKSVRPSRECSDASTVSASIDPASCGGSFPTLSGDWWVTSYSYSKEDGAMPGQESWALTRWKGLNSSIQYTEPTYILRGISEGQRSDDGAGIDFEGSTYTSYTGNVSANGFGKADTLTMGTVSSIGGGSSAVGYTGQGSASIPYTPLYL